MSTASAHPTHNSSDRSLTTLPAAAQDEVREAVAGTAPISCDPVTLEVMEIRALTDVLLLRLRELEEGSATYSYVRNTLVELNMSLVRTAAQRFAHRRESVEDVLQVGVIGLIKAINGFDPHREVEFVTYALPTITGEMKRFFRDTSWAVHVPRRLQELRLQLAKAGEALEHELGREPTRHELAARLDTTEEEVTEGLLASDAYTAGTLDPPAGDEEGDSPLQRRLGALDRDLENIVDLTALRQILPTLPETDQRILALRFAEDLTQSEIGDRIGCSQMQVSRLLARILAELRAQLDDER
ncbi:SigB/SigF/SigG family RNA polymerase sigma factor [Streptacidiphilus melanogenes]|uniref:SigB/SigF/SigG family RNA polymerase sigma factor n=1 Tax=Streptacidiphilus melanogenes TaxID=411235 RepID=UPI000AB05002|nr:SigB/SigF/SigG family RNA polymerase sigma factor [Streptacidiphilus melanogenes]